MTASQDRARGTSAPGAGESGVAVAESGGDRLVPQRSPVPPVTFRTLVADPPWEIERVIRAGGRRARGTAVPYSFMSIDEIKGLPVADLAADDAHLYLWSTRRLFREGTAAAVARAWGFEPVGEVLWGLRNPGMGTRSHANDHEPVLVAVRGSLPFAADEPMGVHFWRQLYAAGGGKVHSAKPEAFLDCVEGWSPEPRLELFARRARFGWSYWGNESLGTASIDPASEAVA